MKTNIYPVPALERGLDLLEWMISGSEPVTLTQIAQGFGLKVSEIQRPVGCLLQKGYLTRTPSGAYVVSGKLFRLAAFHPPFQQLQRAAQPLMVEFAQETGQSVHLCVPDGDAALLIADVPGGGLIRISLQVGARLDPESTVSGRLLLASGCLMTVKPPHKQLAKRLKKISSQGFESAPSSYAVGIVDTGVVVFSSEGLPLAALTTSELRLRNQKIPSPNMTAVLRAKVEKISHRI